MDTVYSTGFSYLSLYPQSPQSCFGDGQPRDVVLSAKADQDPGVLTEILANGEGIFTKFGPMLAGAPTPPLPLVGSICPYTFLPLHSLPINEGGLAVTVCEPGSVDHAQTLYLVLGPNVPSAIRLQGPNSITAQVVFDLPQVHNPTPSKSEKWAVALNFKTGNQNAGANDIMCGPTCHFTDGNGAAGAVSLKFVDGTCNQGDHSHDSYESFQLSKTIFTLSATLTVSQGQLSGTATLDYGSNVIGPCALKIPSNFVLGGVTAIGVAVVNPASTMQTPAGTYDWVRVRLLSFTLSATPGFFRVEGHPPFPKPKPILEETLPPWEEP